MKTKKYSLRAIAGALKRSISTISDELKRNRVKGAYDPTKAQHKAYVRRHEAKYQGMKIVRHGELHAYIDYNLYADQSPEAIAGRIKTKEKRLPSVSKDSIRRYIASVYGRRVEWHRSIQRKKRRWRKKRVKVTQLKDRTFIDHRPKYIHQRSRVGDAEADFIVSGKSGEGIILTLACRKIRVSFLEQILEVTIPRVHAAFQRIKERFPELHSITIDNDVLFQKHKELEKLLEVKIYFCHPYHSWEKGTIEKYQQVYPQGHPQGE